MTRLDSRIDAELDRLGWSSSTAPANANTLDCWDSQTTERDGIVTIHTQQIIIECYGAALLERLQGLPISITFDHLWHTIVAFQVEE